MNTSKLADFSEIISSIAIIITLVFLTIQMQQNTEAILASSRQAALDADTASLKLSVDNPEMARAMTKTELSDMEVVLVVQSLLVYLRGKENVYAQYKNGVLDEATWERYKSSLMLSLSFERSRNFWENTQRGFDPDFVREVNKMLAQAPVDPTSIPERYRLLLGKPQKK